MHDPTLVQLAEQMRQRERQAEPAARRQPPGEPARFERRGAHVLEQQPTARAVDVEAAQGGDAVVVADRPQDVTLVIQVTGPLCPHGAGGGELQHDVLARSDATAAIDQAPWSLVESLHDLTAKHDL